MVLLPNLAPQYGPQPASPGTGNIKESDLKQTHLVVSYLVCYDYHLNTLSYM